MLNLPFAIVLFLCSSSIHGQSVINLIDMELSGTIMTARNGRNISAYLGIPYADPPIFQLRFKNPQPWSRPYQVRKADTDGNDCPQFNDDGKLIGNEDCLVLNVYSPNTSPEELYPTMVYFHGGENFSKGSGSSKNAGPEYLLDKDIILVTVNYRLGVLGFLSTGDAAAPGNFGLKDQNLALEWIHLNIANFGGDPTRVTIFGQGSGAVSTSLHAIFKPNNGLFSQYISQSGSAMAFWAFELIKDYKKRAFELGNYLNCPMDNSQILINCLRSFDPYTLVDSLDIFNDTKWLFQTWGPTEEPAKLEGAFVTNFPLHQILMRGIKDCPAIFGTVFDEGLQWTAEYYVNDTAYNSIANNLFEYLMYIIKTYFDAYTFKSTTKDLQEFYFDGVDPSDKKAIIQNITNLLTDFGFRLPITQHASLMGHSYTAPLYLYTFDYRGTYSKTSATLGNNDNIGVTHGDDLIYLFPTKTSDIQLNESDESMIDVMVDFWTSFAYNGAPTSEHVPDPDVWKPYATETLMSLKIGNNSDATDFEEYPVADIRVMFWYKLLAKVLLEPLYNS